MWRVDDGSFLHTFEGHTETVWDVCALGTDRLASAGADGTVRVWQADDGSLLHTLEGHVGWVQSVCALGADRLASAGEDGSVRVWRADDGSPLQFLEGHHGKVERVCAPAVDRLASVDEEGIVQVWQADDGSLLYTLEGKGVYAVGGDRLATTGKDGSIHVWRASDGSRLHTLEGHRGSVRNVCALGEDRLASAGTDGTIRIWIERGDTFEPDIVLLPRTSTSELRFTYASVRWPIAITRSDRPWLTRSVDDKPLPADPELHELAAFTTVDASRVDDPTAPSSRVPIHAFPDHLDDLWSWSTDRKTLYLAWPTDAEARRVLRRWVFGPRYEQDPPP